MVHIYHPILTRFQVNVHKAIGFNIVYLSEIVYVFVKAMLGRWRNIPVASS